jgi:vitamin B12 transporter
MFPYKSAVQTRGLRAANFAVSIAIYAVASSVPALAQSTQPEKPAASTSAQSQPAQPAPKPNRERSASKPPQRTATPAGGVVLPPVTVRPPAQHSVVAPPPSTPTNQGSGQAVVVSPTTIPTPSSETASSVSVITSVDIETRQLRTVPDALATVPGLNVVQTGGPGGLTSVFMRGTNSNHVKVLIDGIDVSDPSSANAAFDFGQLLTGDIERIEVLRGPQSGLYGSDAIGGVISITTKQGSGPPKVTASFEGGSFGTTREQLGLSGSQDGFNYAFNFQHFQSASVPVTPLDLLAPGEQRNNDFYDNKTYSMKLGKTLSDTVAVNVVARYTDSQLRSTGEDCVNFPQMSPVPCAPEVLQSTQTDHQFFGRAELVLTPTNDFKNYLGINYTNEYTWFNNPNADTGFTSPLVAPPSTTIGTRVKFDDRSEIQLAPGQLLLVGLEHQNETLRTDSTDSLDANFNATYFTTNAQRYDDAAWLQSQNQITKQFSLVSNIRFDNYSDFGEHTTWRVAPVFVVPGTDTKLKATYGTGFKAPSLFDLYVNFPPDFVGNPNLKPEESKGWDAGFEQPIAGGRFNFGATYFHNDVTNLISTGVVPSTVNSSVPVFTNVNIDSASISGVESFAAWKVTNSLNLRLDYTWTEAIDNSTDQQLLRRPKNKGSVTADWKATDRLTLSSTVLYVGSWTDIDRSGFLTGLRASPFTTVNLAANYAASDNVSYFMRVDNLLNKQYEDPIGFLRPGIGIYGGIRLNGLPASGDAGLAFIPPFLRNGGSM